MLYVSKAHHVLSKLFSSSILKAALPHDLLTIAFCSVGRAMELQKQPPKHLSTPSSVSPEPQDSAKLRQGGLASEKEQTLATCQPIHVLHGFRGHSFRKEGKRMIWVS